jgi:1,4-dihydroxy-2-naphthoate octaprenyltransferase
VSILKSLVQLSRPLYLLFAALTYLLGAGMARYLGHPLVPAVFLLGLGGVLLAQLTMDLLVEVFRPSSDPILPSADPLQRKSVRDAALHLSIGALAVEGAIAFVLFRLGQVTLPGLTFLGASLLALLAYSVPPLRLVDRGLGELTLAVQLAYLIPSISFLLESGSFHRLLYVVNLPLTLLLTAAFLSLDLPTYAEDLKFGRRSLVLRLGWENAIPLHHGLIIAAYVLLAAAPVLGFSFGLLWPAFLTLPFALLQILWLRNIALGGRPIWGMLTTNAWAVFGLTAYFLTMTFWLR